MRVTLASLAARARRRDDERGATMVIVALSMIAMVGMVVLVVDVGGLLWRRREMVSAADAAALAAAQSCALGEAVAGDPDAQADAFAVDNVSGITPTGGVVWGDTVNCEPEGGGEGRVKVEYTATQDLWFAGIFGASSADIETAAVAEWGDASTGWPVPFIVTLDSAGNVFCKNEVGDPVEINEDTPQGTRCAVWFDNSSSGGYFGGFGESVFGSLNLKKWNVDPTFNCSSQDLDDNKHYAEVGGYDDDEGLKPLNYPDPTWVCSGSGNVDVLFSSLQNVTGQILVFPITDKQVMLDPSGVIDKFNVVGYVALFLEQVLDASQTGATTATCGALTGQSFNTGAQFDLVTASLTCTPYEQIVDLKVTGPNGCCKLDKDYELIKNTSGRLTGFRWLAAPKTGVSVTWNVLKSGPCGPKPSNSSGHCMVVRWEEAQLGNGPLGGNNVGVPTVRLCDPGIPGSCDTAP